MVPVIPAPNPVLSEQTAASQGGFLVPFPKVKVVGFAENHEELANSHFDWKPTNSCEQGSKNWPPMLDVCLLLVSRPPWFGNWDPILVHCCQVFSVLSSLSSLLWSPFAAFGCPTPVRWICIETSLWHHFNDNYHHLCNIVIWSKNNCSFPP